jgi:hypothetical protein
MMVHAYNPSYFGSRGKRIMYSKSPPGKVNKTLSQNQNISKGAVDMAQVVQHLPSMCNNLGSNSSIAEKRKSMNCSLPLLFYSTIFLYKKKTIK